MARDYLADARRHFDKLVHVAENHGLPSDEASYHYNQISECYGKAPANIQSVVLTIVENSDVIWNQLKANQAAQAEVSEQEPPTPS